MRSLIFSICMLVGLTAPLAASASDLHFYEAARGCRTLTDAHPFRLRFMIGQRTAFMFDQDTALTQCLSREAQAKDEDGSERRLSIGANLERAVVECGAKFGKAGNFFVDFTPEPQGYFSTRIGPEYEKSRACIAMLTSLMQPFGAKQ